MSIFTKIIKEEIPSYKIAENDDFFVFLDINPNAAGHTLVVPKKEVDKVFDLEDELYTKLFQYSKTIAAAIEKAVPCKRVGMSVIGLEVPHVHVHLIPLNQMADATFGKKEKLTESEFKTLAKKIASYL
ncbi:HIT family protein [Wenyingzhuangia marina]|uniref:Histidine triad (HIT) family protein n=1 Tax=Wenyingzhuangia marina TaxID=1195760 RepID=A0A1M5SPX5_9FLAO|nr:HIT family protein [Wenyingzhuangia marina]GGF63327.1 hydrolase [Wenyingzhuangia marina]SHH40536.1 histidine triad (HIT) family protein [Wenyingzhuangia marina]